MNQKPTTPFNAQPKKFNGKTAVGVAAGAAVLGVGGTAAAMHVTNSDEKPEEDTDASAEEIVIGDDNFNPDAPVSGDLGSVISSFTHTSDSTTTETTHTNTHRINNSHTNTNNGHSNNSNNNSNNNDDTNNGGTNNGGHANNGGETNNDGDVIEEITPISPDEILSETAIDPDDNDATELLSFDNMELVPDEEGNVTVQAEFTMDGANYTMIDVDNDGVFDGVADASGAYAGSAGGMMVSDIELINNSNNHDYMAATDYDNNTEISGSGDSSVNDTIDI